MRMGIDTGGTFTDFVSIREGVIEAFKILSTPASPEQAILKGLERPETAGATDIVHGSTVATNALLERKGARTALVTTAGFEDVLVIGRQTRPDLYDIFTSRPAPLVADRLRLGVRERTLFDGTVEKALDPEDLASVFERLGRERVESIAVSLLFSFVNPDHEERVRSALDGLGVPISLSSRILPEHREYERTSTTVINAYLAPVMRRYLQLLESGLGRRKLRVMQSNGGAVRVKRSVDAPVGTLLSGPAGGVVGAFFLAKRSGRSRVVTFDMGGTSTDVALLDGGIPITHESRIEGMPVGIPMMDIHTVGAGGGSIARLDAGGALVVGPESAGADPGPICYGTGDALTVTDANLILGRLLGRFFLGGEMRLTPERIERVVATKRWTRKWKSLQHLAQGVIDVVNNNMEQAIRLISVERGHDVRDFALVCFGGAGGLHAATLAAGLGITEVIVPLHPGALSALGLLLADSLRDYSETLLGRGKPSLALIRKSLDRLHRAGVRDLTDEGFHRKDIRISDAMDVRYAGQSYELTIPFGADWEESFHRAHERRYGHASPQSPLEVVSVRATLSGIIGKPVLEPKKRKAPQPSPLESRRVWLGGRWRRTEIYERRQLGYGNVIGGPAVVGEYSSTTFVPSGFRCEVDRFLNLVLSPIGR